MDTKTIIEDGEFKRASITDDRCGPSPIFEIDRASPEDFWGGKEDQPLVTIESSCVGWETSDLRTIAKLLTDIADQLDYEEDEFGGANNELPFVA